MRDRGTVWMVCVCATVVACSVMMSNAGPLDPPVGPVEPTFTTLDEVDPSTPLDGAYVTGDASAVFIIKQPGAYHLVRDIVGDNGMSGVRIEASGVTIDMRGYNLVGSSMSGDGIVASPDTTEPDNERRAGIVVKGHGRIEGWDGWGIDLSLADRSRVEDVIVSGCRSGGITMGSGAQVRRVASEANEGTNISCLDGAILEACSAHASVNGDGIRVRSGAVIEKCTASDNAGSGVVCEDGSVLDRCVAQRNGGDGIRGNNRVVCRSSSASGNAANGIALNDHATVDACTSTGNGMNGLLVRDNSTVRACTLSSNGTNGFDAGRTANVHACTAALNGEEGFRFDQECLVVECFARGNTRDGFVAPEDGHFIGCYATRNQNGFVSLDFTVLEGCYASLHTQSSIIVGDLARVENCTVMNSLGLDGNNRAILLQGSRALAKNNHVVRADIGFEAIGALNGLSRPRALLRRHSRRW